MQLFCCQPHLESDKTLTFLMDGTAATITVGTLKQHVIDTLNLDCDLAKYMVLKYCGIALKFDNMSLDYYRIKNDSTIYLTFKSTINSCAQ
jgi:hypothetical protein